MDINLLVDEKGYMYAFQKRRWSGVPRLGIPCTVHRAVPARRFLAIHNHVYAEFPTVKPG